MSRIVSYPAVLELNQGTDIYTVTFPDVPEAISEGHGVAQACYRASEALGLVLYDESELPEMTDAKVVESRINDGEVTYITVDLDQIKQQVRKPMVKKNTTSPYDLAKQAEQAGINFSEVLTNALECKLAH